MNLTSFSEIERRVGEHCGIYESDILGYESAWHKLKDGHYKPGCKIKIHWTKEYEGIEDVGYLMTLPGPDNDDVYMAGVVHIPEPQGSSDEPVWIHFADLVDNPYTKSISLT